MGKKARLKKLRKETQGGGGPLAAEPVSFVLSEKTQKITAVVIISALLAFGIALRLGNLEVRGRSPDEGVYTGQAKVVAQDGVDGIRRLIGEYDADKEAWIYPPPIRIGYTFLLAPVMKASGAFDERAGSYLSTACSIGALIVLVLIGLRFFNPWITAAALLLMSVSPMDLAIARRTWQDSVLAFFGVLLVYFCCELTANPKRTAWYVPFWLIGSYCIIIKESGIVVYGLCVIWLLAVTVFKERSAIKSALLIAFTLAGIALSVFMLGQVAGGIGRILEVLRHVKDAMPTNTYAIDYQTGPWYRILEGLWILTPAGVLLSVVGIAVSFINRTAQSGVYKGIVFFIFAFLGITILTPYCQNIRYISVLYAPFYLMAGAGVWHIFSFVKPSLKGRMPAVAAVVIACALIAISVRDYKKFDKVFLKTGIRDISVRLLKETS
jgi:hypothetical protein